MAGEWSALGAPTKSSGMAAGGVGVSQALGRQAAPGTSMKGLSRTGWNGAGSIGGARSEAGAW